MLLKVGGMVHLHLPKRNLSFRFLIGSSTPNFGIAFSKFFSKMVVWNSSFHRETLVRAPNLPEKPLRNAPWSSEGIKVRCENIGKGEPPSCLCCPLHTCLGEGNLSCSQFSHLENGVEVTYF